MTPKWDYKDPAQLRAYKAGWMVGSRLRRFFPRPGMSQLAYQCMLNHFERARRTDKIRTKRKPSQSEGNQEWKQLSATRK